MDHRYIDDRSVAERYLDHALSAPERLEFEAHLVDCQECTDRVLLAEMFHNRNGKAKVMALPKPGGPPETLRVRISWGRRSFAPWRLFLMMAAGAALLAALLVLVPSLLWLVRR